MYAWARSSVRFTEMYAVLYKPVYTPEVQIDLSPSRRECENLTPYLHVITASDHSASQHDDDKGECWWLRVSYTKAVRKHMQRSFKHFLYTPTQHSNSQHTLLAPRKKERARALNENSLVARDSRRHTRTREDEIKSVVPLHHAKRAIE